MVLWLQKSVFSLPNLFLVTSVLPTSTTESGGPSKVLPYKSQQKESQ